MDRYITHATFSLERSYPVPPARHQLDFRVGGREVAHGGPEDGPVMTFESLYRDIVPVLKTDG